MRSPEKTSPASASLGGLPLPSSASTSAPRAVMQAVARPGRGARGGTVYVRRAAISVDEGCRRRSRQCGVLRPRRVATRRVDVEGAHEAHDNPDAGDRLFLSTTATTIKPPRRPTFPVLHVPKAPGQRQEHEQHRSTIGGPFGGSGAPVWSSAHRAFRVVAVCIYDRVVPKYRASSRCRRLSARPTRSRCSCPSGANSP